VVPVKPLPFDLYYDLWEMLIQENPRCKIVIQTNGTYLNERIRDVLSRGNFQIGVSLDSLEKQKFESHQKECFAGKSKK
jgi:sulfatase maturation enzyme AslB (radical SAM superfamily)